MIVTHYVKLNIIQGQMVRGSEDTVTPDEVSSWSLTRKRLKNVVRMREERERQIPQNNLVSGEAPPVGSEMPRSMCQEQMAAM